MARVRVSISLNTDGDADIIRWLDRQTNASQAIRDAIRDAIGTSGVITLADIYHIVTAIERKLDKGVVVNSAAEPDDYQEPPDIAATLDALGA